MRRKVLLKRVPFGAKCKHSGMTMKKRLKLRSPYNDTDIVFIKTSDASQMTNDGREVIFHPNDIVEII